MTASLPRLSELCLMLKLRAFDGSGSHTHECLRAQLIASRVNLLLKLFEGEAKWLPVEPDRIRRYRTGIDSVQSRIHPNIASWWLLSLSYDCWWLLGFILSFRWVGVLGWSSIRIYVSSLLLREVGVSLFYNSIDWGLDIKHRISLRLLTCCCHWHCDGLRSLNGLLKPWRLTRVDEWFFMLLSLSRECSLSSWCLAASSLWASLFNCFYVSSGILQWSLLTWRKI
jgi:hypothetical protein